MQFARTAPGSAATCASASRTASTSARGVLATSNAQQVRKIRAVVEDLGRRIATPGEAAAMLALKGAKNITL